MLIIALILPGVVCLIIWHNIQFRVRAKREFGPEIELIGKQLGWTERQVLNKLIRLSVWASRPTIAAILHLVTLQP